MSAESDANAALDDLLNTLDDVIGQTEAGEPAGGAAAGAGDAIDAVLSSSPRVTGVRSVRHAAEVEAFRQAVVDGLIRVDTVNRLLKLVNGVVVQLLAR